MSGEEQAVSGEDPIAALKRAGNAEYAKGNFATAIESFSAAIEVIRGRLSALDEAAGALVASTSADSGDSGRGDGGAELKPEAARAQAAETRAEAKVLAATLFNNRSMCFSGLGEWSKCVDDSRMAIQLNPKYEKAYFRLIKTYLELKKFKEARLYLVIGFNSCPDSKFLKALDAELTAATGVPSRPKPTDFDILDELGDGNFSKIFKAEYKPTKKVYAIKTIEKQTVDRMKRRHKNIHNEILMEKRALNKLSHPNIVHLFATFQDYGTLYYQMEFLAGEVWTMLQDDIGGSYEKVNRGNASSVGCYFSLGRFYLAECLDALEYMHANGITHRDLKPENMMITATGHLKLVDFGTCKDLRQTDLNGQEFVGTAEYMAPEVVDSENSGPAADLWSLGVVLYHMVMGYTPFKAPSPYLSFLRIKRAFLRLPTDLPHAEEVNEVLRALLQRDPAQRLINAAGSIPYDPANTENFSYNTLRELTLFRGVRTLGGAREGQTQAGHGGESVEAAVQAVRVPTLREMAVRAVANASLLAAEHIAANGGVRNAALPSWVQDFKLCAPVDSTPSPLRLAATDRASIMLYLSNKTELHAPSVYRLFFASVIDSRNLRTDLVDREYIGYSRSNQGQWSEGFSGVHFANPLFGQAALATGTGAVNCDKEHARLRTAISAINKMRPKFVVVNGNFTAAPFEEANTNEAEGTDNYTVLHKEFRRCMARISESIPVLYVPGVNDVGAVPSPQSIARYHALYGCDFYGFWFGGVRVLVVNSSLLIRPELIPEHAAFQHTWLVEELEQCKLCAMQVVVFAYHSFFEEEEEEDEDVKVEGGAARSNSMPRSVRDYWLPRFRNFKVKFLFSANQMEGREVRTHASSVIKKKKKPKKRAQKVEEVDEQGVALSEVALDVDGLQVPQSEDDDEEEEEVRRARRRARDTHQRGSELKPSEILALERENVDMSSSSESSDDEEDEDKGDEQPIFEKREKVVYADGEYEDSSPFSPDLLYSGPTAVNTAAMGGVGGEGSEEEKQQEDGVLRVLSFEDEETARQTLFRLDNIPAKLPDLS